MKYPTLRDLDRESKELVGSPTGASFAEALLTASIPEVGSGKWRLISCNVSAYRKKLGKRILFLTASYLDEQGQEHNDVPLVAKMYGSDRGARAYRTLQALWEAGYRPPSDLRITRPYGYSSNDGVLVQEEAPGISWADCLVADGERLDAVSRRAAGWLEKLQRTPITGPIDIKQWKAALSVERHVRELLAAYPDVSSLRSLEETGAWLIRLLKSKGITLVPSHGDYHPKNVFLTDGSVVVIDFDTFGLREPAWDVGYAIGQLLVMSYFRLGDFRSGARAATAFWDSYCREGEAVWPRVALYIAATFIQSLRYELLILRNGRDELLDLWPIQAEKWLASAGPADLERFTLVATPENIRAAG